MWRKREIQKIMTKNEALQKALDALGPTPPDCCGCQEEWQIAIDAIKEALANDTSQERVAKTSENVHEPVAWISATELLVMRGNAHGGAKDWRVNLGLEPEEGDVGLYTTPPQRTWVGLTDEEIKSIWLNEKDYGDDWLDVQGIARAIEAKLKEKNFD